MMETKEATLYELKTTKIMVDPHDGFKRIDTIVASNGDLLSSKHGGFSTYQMSYPVRKMTKFLNVGEHIADPINVELIRDDVYFVVDEAAEEFSTNTLDAHQEDLKDKIKDAAVKYNRLIEEERSKIEEERAKVHTWFNRFKYLLTNDKKHLS